MVLKELRVDPTNLEEFFHPGKQKGKQTGSHKSCFLRENGRTWRDSFSMRMGGGCIEVL